LGLGVAAVARRARLRPPNPSSDRLVFPFSRCALAECASAIANGGVACPCCGVDVDAHGADFVVLRLCGNGGGVGNDGASDGALVSSEEMRTSIVQRLFGGGNSGGVASVRNTNRNRQRVVTYQGLVAGHAQNMNLFQWMLQLALKQLRVRSESNRQRSRAIEATISQSRREFDAYVESAKASQRETLARMEQLERQSQGAYPAGGDFYF
jgi:hypothetical protein